MKRLLEIVEILCSCLIMGRTLELLINRFLECININCYCMVHYLSYV